MNQQTNVAYSETTAHHVQKKKRDDMCTSDGSKLFDYTPGGGDVSLQGQGTRTSNYATFGELRSEIMQISRAQRRD